METVLLDSDIDIVRYWYRNFYQKKPPSGTLLQNGVVPKNFSKTAFPSSEPFFYLKSAPFWEALWKFSSKRSGPFLLSSSPFCRIFFSVNVRCDMWQVGRDQNATYRNEGIFQIKKGIPFLWRKCLEKPIWHMGSTIKLFGGKNPTDNWYNVISL